MNRLRFIICCATFFTILLNNVALENAAKEESIAKALYTKIEPKEEKDVEFVKEIDFKEIERKAKEVFPFEATYVSPRKINIIATFYTNSVSDCGNTKGVTSSGDMAIYGYIAAPKNIPFDTKILIEKENGDRETFIVKDRGGAVKWLDENTMKVDIFIPNASHSQLMQMGKRKWVGYILN